MRIHRIPFSTNVERVALAAGHKGLPVEWVDHDPADRSAIRELSGQELVPVAEIEGEVLYDSPRIVDRIEQLAPDPPLYPGDPAALARRLARWQSVFEELLDGRDHLFGDFGIADVMAFPFLKYAVAEADPADTDPFHAILREHLRAGPRMRAWIERVDARPRA